MPISDFHPQCHHLTFSSSMSPFSLIFELHLSYIWVTFELHLRYISATFQLHLSYISVTFELHFSYISVTFELHLRYISVSFELHVSFIRATFQFQPGYISVSSIVVIAVYQLYSSCSTLFSPASSSMRIPHTLIRMQAHRKPAKAQKWKKYQMHLLVSLRLERGSFQLSNP